MTTKREYAVKLGLAKFGKGRMSREANAAILKATNEGMVFSDGIAVVAPTNSGSLVSNGTVKQVAKLPDQTIMHGFGTIWGIDYGRTDLVIAFQHCGSCGRAIKYCVHDIPQLPAFVGGGNALLEKPNV